MSKLPVISGAVALNTGAIEATDAFKDGVLITQDAEVRAADSGTSFYRDGLPFTSTGQLRYVDATSGLPGDVKWENGFPLSGDALCVSTDSGVGYRNGIPFAANYAVSATYSGSSFTPVLNAPLTTGLAPFGVVFDGVQTTHPDPNIRPYHDLLYFMDFGDGSSGNYSIGEYAGTTKNRDLGAPVFCHVYETPGTYTASMWVHDGTTLVGPVQKTITAKNPNEEFPGASTIAISDTADFSWAPAGAVQITQSVINTGLANAAVTSNKRVLLRPNGSYTCSSSSLKSNLKNFVLATAPGGASAIITFTAAGQDFLAGFAGSSNPANNANSWRIHDLDIRGGGFANARGVVTTIIPTATGDANLKNFNAGDITVHRVTCDGLSASVWPQGGNNTVVSQVTSTNTTGAGGKMPIYGSGVMRLGIIDCDLDSAHGGEHVTRIQGADYLAIVSSRFARPAASKQYLTAREWGNGSAPGPGIDTLYHAQRANTIDGTTQTVTTSIYTDTAPQATTFNGPIKDSVWESNFYAGCQADQALLICARDVTIRNNVFSYVQRVSGSSKAIQISNPNNTMSTLTDNVRVLGNTAYSSGTNGFSMVTIQNAVVNPYVCNNIAYAPSATANGSNTPSAPNLIDAASSFPATLVQSSNSTDANVKSLDPLFVGTTTFADFKLQTGSPYKNFGADYKTKADALAYLKGAAPIDAGALNSVDKQVDAWSLIP